jgi:hypothetical protein
VGDISQCVLKSLYNILNAVVLFQLLVKLDKQRNILRVVVGVESFVSEAIVVIGP